MGCIQSKEPDAPPPPARRTSTAKKTAGRANGGDGGHKESPASVPDEDPKISPEELAESLTTQANSGDIHELYQFGKKIGKRLDCSFELSTMMLSVSCRSKSLCGAYPGAGGYAVVYKAVELKTNRQASSSEERFPLAAWCQAGACCSWIDTADGEILLLEPEAEQIAPLRWQLKLSLSMTDRRCRLRTR